MKRISLTLFTLCCLAAAAIAQVPYCNLTLSAENGEYFQLFLDGEMINDKLHQRVHLEGLKPGAHKARIVFEEAPNQFINITKNLYLEPGQRYKFNIRRKGNEEWALRMYDMQPIDAPPAFAPGFHNPDPVAQPVQATIPGGVPAPPRGGADFTMNVGGLGMGISVNEFGMDFSGGTYDQGVRYSVHTPGLHPHEVYTDTEPMPTQTVPPSGVRMQVGGQMGVRCPQPMPPSQFNQLRVGISNVRLETTKLAQAEQAVVNNCLNSLQVQQLVSLLTMEDNRLAMAKFAWDYVQDPANYHLVFEAFGLERTAQQLQAYMAAHPFNLSVEVQEPVLHEVYEPYPDVTAPPRGPAGPQVVASAVPGYSGPCNCAPGMFPMDNNGFNAMLGSVKNQSFSDGQRTVAQQALRNNCITVAQLRLLLEEFSFEKDKLDMAKFAYAYTYDVGNFFQINDGFSFSTSTRDLEQFIAAQPQSGFVVGQPTQQMAPVRGPGFAPQPQQMAPAAAGCFQPTMGPGQWTQALESVENQSFSDGQKTVARQILRNNCVSVNQVKQLMELFSFDDDKVEIAQAAYPSVVDPQNYFQLNDAFSFSSSVEKLNRFLESQR